MQAVPRISCPAHKTASRIILPNYRIYDILEGRTKSVCQDFMFYGTAPSASICTTYEESPSLFLGILNDSNRKKWYTHNRSSLFLDQKTLSCHLLWLFKTHGLKNRGCNVTKDTVGLL